MTVYKVVWQNRENPETYYSALVSGQAFMTYRIGEVAAVPDWLASRGYYATAFTELQAAQRFAEVVRLNVSVFSPRIFKAEGEVCMELPPRAPIFHVVHGLLDPQSGADWPAETVMVKSLRLTEEVDVGGSADATADEGAA
jgi:hypothetical protein